MRDRILKLCKRLDKFTFEEIVSIAEDVEESVLEFSLKTLVKENKLTEKDGVYYYNKNPKINYHNRFSILSYYPSKILDLIIKGFCTSIPAYKLAQLLNIYENSAVKIYNIFRTLIYEQQYNILKQKYSTDPERARSRIFFDKNIYFYCYDDKVFVSDNCFNNTDTRNFTLSEIKEFKMVYSYLTRYITHNKMEYHLVEKLAEGIWRRNKTFDELYSDLKNNLLS